MSTAGPLSPNTAADDGSGGAWANPNNTKLSDTAYTTVTAARRMLVDSGNLVVSHFDFAIPAGATINGIQVDIQRKYAGTGGSVFDAGITMTKDAANAAGWTTDANNWTTTEHYDTWGDATELWNTTWTPAEINNDGFGVMLMISVSAGSSYACIAYVNHVRITVYYTTVAGVKASTMMTMGVG
jgi:hypothetical protein